MDITEFKSQISRWPRDKRGRLVLSVEKRIAIVEAFRSCGLEPKEFAAATDMNSSTIYKILNRSRKGFGQMRPRRDTKKAIEFSPVKIIEKISPWIVSGPRGIRVECVNINQLTELWRALC